MHMIANTPWWVYLFFVLLILIGLNGTKHRTVPIYRITLLPAIFTIWNILWLLERTHEHFSLASFWFTGILVGGFIGWQTVQAWHIHADHHKKTISLPGTWTTLVLILLVFCVRYYFVYTYITQPKIAPHLYVSDAMISGLFTGIFIGRALEIYRKYSIRT